MRQRLLRLLRASAACACCAGLAGCAGVGSQLTTADSAGPFLPEHVSTQAAGRLVAPGQSKADVVAALGKAASVRFDSGYEVWVYRDRPSAGPGSPGEFVILFAPTGVVKKTRIRPGDAVPAS
jgi:hypothetical protein